MYAEGKLSDDKKSAEIYFAAKNEVFGEWAAGSPFNVYAASASDLIIRNYAVIAGGHLRDQWLLSDFKNENYHLKVNGPNGFFREFRGDADEPAIDISLEYARSKSNSKKN